MIGKNCIEDDFNEIKKEIEELDIKSDEIKDIIDEIKEFFFIFELDIEALRNYIFKLKNYLMNQEKQIKRLNIIDVKIVWNLINYHPCVSNLKRNEKKDFLLDMEVDFINKKMMAEILTCLYSENLER